MPSKGICVPEKIIYSLFIAFLIVTVAPAAAEVTAENRVSYLGRPAVVMINSEYVGNLENDDGESTVYLSSDDPKFEAEVEIPQFSAGFFGSGFVVSRDGYIVTNAHVVHEPEDELKSEFALQALEWAAEEWPAIFVANGDEPYPSTEEIETSDELPTATLGDSKDVEVGDKVMVIGYPGVTTSWQNAELSAETDYVPSVTSGIISAKKRLPDRSEAFQTDAAIYHGNSGGPAFNAEGEVIGIATFGSGKTLVSGDWIDVQGYNFLIPINVAKSFISELNIDTTPSETTKAFERGFEHYWNGSRSEARGEFDAILALDPKNQYAAEYSSMAQRLTDLN